MNTSTPTKSLIFHTGGEIDPASWEIVGLSAKETENPLGFFGSGLKHSTAILLRTGHKVRVETSKNGERVTYEFGTRDMDFRGKDFKRVTCNEQDLSYTTHMGSHWELWQAYRELVSNTIDEGGIWYAGDPMPDGTSFVIEGPVIECLKDHERYFVGDREPLVVCDGLMEVHKGNGTIFYRGVKVGEIAGSRWSYNMLQTIELTEDRTIKHPSVVHGQIGLAWCQYVKDEKLLRELMTVPQSAWEHDVDLDWSWSQEFLKVADNLWTNAPTTLTKQIQRLMKRRNPSATFACREKTEDEAMMLERALEVMATIGYPVTAPVELVDNEDDNNIAFIHDSKIHLTNRAFDRGLFFLLTVLMEERSHVSGYSDESRAFESYLIEELIKHAAKRHRIVL
jgi:hypothetical protein